MEAKERDNIIRWDGRPGWYEVYYMKWNDPANNAAFWVRYTLTSPAGGGEPFCELWGIFFDSVDPSKNFAVKQRFGINRFEAEKDRFALRIADAEMTMNMAKGVITDGVGNDLGWDLELSSDSPTFRHFPHQWMYTAGFPKTKVLSPHEDCRFTGSVTANGRTISFVDAPGQQTHIWGVKHALRWSWGHCNAFHEDNSAIWEGLDSQIKLGPIKSPHLSLFYLRHQGEDHLFNSIGSLFTNKSDWSLGKWTFTASGKELDMKGEITCDYSALVGVTYEDPDGENLWCNNSKVADIKIELFGKDGSEKGVLTADGVCAAEFVDRRTYPEVPILI